MAMRAKQMSNSAVLHRQWQFLHRERDTPGADLGSARGLGTTKVPSGSRAVPGGGPLGGEAPRKLMRIRNLRSI